MEVGGRCATDSLRGELIAAQREGHNFAMIAKATGVNRSIISQYANGKDTIRRDHHDALREYLDQLDAGTSGPDQPAARRYKTAVELFETAEFQETKGFLRYMHTKRRMGILIGYPGSGKTTALKEYVGRCRARSM